MSKRILMLTHEFPPFKGGVGTYCYQLATAAAERGHHVTVYAPDHGQDIGEIDAARNFRIIRYRSDTYDFKKLPSLLLRTNSITRRLNYDILHAVDTAYLLALSFLNRFRNLPFIATAYGTDILAMPSSRQARWLGISDLFARPKRVCAISQFARDLLFERFPEIESSKVTVASLGLSEFWYQSTDEKSQIRKKYGIDSDRLIVLTVARLDDRKGHLSVIGAIQQLPEEVQRRIAYVIVGSGDESYRARLQMAAEQIVASVHFLGSVSDPELRELYGQAYLYCMPNEAHPDKVEGFGLVYLEAAASGVPSVASRIGGVPEAVLDGTTGILVEPGDVDAIAEAMQRMIGDTELRDRMGQAALDHSRSFNWQRCAELTYEY